MSVSIDNLAAKLGELEAAVVHSSEVVAGLKATIEATGGSAAEIAALKAELAAAEAAVDGVSARIEAAAAVLNAQ